jgi:hypothetical protein
VKITQKGCLPITILILMGFFFLCITSFSVYFFYGFITEGYLQRVDWAKLNLSWFVTKILPVLFYILANIYIGVVALSFFPHVSLTASGLFVRSLLSKTTIEWDEIKSMRSQSLPKGIILVIDREKSNIFHPKSLFIHHIYGFLFGFFKPIIFISQTSETYAEIFNRMKIK